MNILKISLVSLLLFFITSSYSQDFAQNAVGLRFGGGNGFGTEVTYQRALGEGNRLEVDLGWNSDDDFDGFKLVGLYQWVWYLDGNFNWYAGAGGGLGSYDYDNPIGPDVNDTFLLFAGQVGIEYNFDEIPLQLSLDTRPELGLGDISDDLDFGIALGVRYRFN
jgi:hypothetical protein